MSPSIALLSWFVLLLALFWFDSTREVRVSAAVWVPLTWIFFMASRQPAQWLGGDIDAGSQAAVAEALQDGNPMNRAVSLALLFLGIAILVSRSFQWGQFLSRNKVLIAYLAFAMVSVIWSDFPAPAFRKWFRDLSSYIMILVVLSDPEPLEAIRTLLRRLGYLLIPLSIVLIKYFPDIGRQYDPWTGDVTYSGATTSKNMLGIICLVCGTYLFWDIVSRWQDRRERRQKQIILVNTVLFCMVLWLLITCDSATSRMCLLLACSVIVAARTRLFQRRPRLLTGTIPCVFLLYVFLAFGLGLKGDFAQAVGRDATLSGRTQIWEIVLSQHTDPLLGAGYESFWMGPRLDRIWASGMGQLNEAHNGYLEVYLNLGYVGLFLLLALMVAVYRNVCRELRTGSDIASLALAIWTVFLFHNCTEADFRSGLMWVSFILAALAVSTIDQKTESELPAWSTMQTDDLYIVEADESGAVMRHSGSWV